MYPPEDCAEIPTLLCGGRENLPLAAHLCSSPPACGGLCKEETHRALTKDTGINPSGLLWCHSVLPGHEELCCRRGSRSCPFPGKVFGDSLWNLIILKNSLKELVRKWIDVPQNQQATCCCPQTSTIWAEEVPYDLGMVWSRCQVPRLRFDKNR